jgi:hypothetical protein
MRGRYRLRVEKRFALILTACLSVVCGVLAATPASAAPARPTVSPAAPVAGEKVTISGTFGKKAGVRVVLQRRGTKRWSAVASATTRARGAYTFSTTMTRANLKVRVKARSSAKTSGVRTIKPTLDDVSLRIDGSGTTATATVTATAPRRGRSVVLERREGSAWVRVGEPVLWGQGSTARIALTGLTQRQLNYRATLAAWNGAPKQTSTRVSFAPSTFSATHFDVPVLHIDTADPDVVINKVDKSPAALRIDGAKSHALTIRGRGNSTWGWVKKPYRLQLDKKASLLGMPANKNWVLLANMADRSHLRTTVAMSLGAKADGLDWTPRSRPVELVLNGDYMGAYQLVEHVRRDPARVAEDTNLFELDRRFTLDNADGDQGVITERDTRVVLSDPDDQADLEDGLTLAEVQDHLNAFEDALVTHSYDAWKSFIDLDSFVDFYLVTELMKGRDSDCWTSCYFTWTRGERIAMGPLWDFDQSGGFKISDPGADMVSPEGWWVNGDYDAARYPARPHFQWYAHLWQTPEFREAVAQRWREWIDTGVVGSITREFTAHRAVLGTSLLNDWERWSWVQTPRGRVNATTAEGEVEFLRTWLSSRIAWMTRELAAHEPS